MPFTACVSALAVGFTLAYWAGLDVGFAFEDGGIWKGQYWRFILSCFVHLDVLHLLFNISAGWNLSAPLERHFGWRKMLLLFAVLAVGSGAAQFLTGDPGIGLSGVFYGYFGLIIAAGKCPGGPRITLPPRDILVILIWFVLCIVMSATGEWGIGNASHAAGLIIGVGMGLALRTSRPKPWIVGITVAALSLAPATLYMPWSDEWWVHRGSVLYAKGDHAGARAAVAKALAEMPDDDRSYGLLIWLGCNYADHGDLDRGLECFRRAMNSPVDQGRGRGYVACALLQRKEYAEARKLLLECDMAEVGPLAKNADFQAAMGWARGPADAPPPDFRPASAPATSSAAAD